MKWIYLFFFSFFLQLQKTIDSSSRQTADSSSRRRCTVLTKLGAASRLDSSKTAAETSGTARPSSGARQRRRCGGSLRQTTAAVLVTGLRVLLRLSRWLGSGYGPAKDDISDGGVVSRPGSGTGCLAWFGPLIWFAILTCGLDVMVTAGDAHGLGATHGGNGLGFTWFWVYRLVSSCSSNDATLMTGYGLVSKLNGSSLIWMPKLPKPAIRL